MKILKIISLGYEHGGIESTVVAMQPLLEEKGHIVRIFASDARPDLPHFNQYSYKTPSGMGKVFSTLFNVDAYRSLRRTLKEFQPDVVHIDTIGYASPIILFLLKKYPTVLTINNPEGFTKSLLLWCFPSSYFKNGEYTVDNLRSIGKIRYVYHRYVERALYIFGLRNIDVFVTLSIYMHETMKRDGLENIYVPNGASLFSYKPFEKDVTHTTIAYVGRLEKVKGVEYIIAALPVIIAKFPLTHVYIAGDGSDRKNLEILVTEAGMRDHVTFVGHLNSVELEKLYQRATIVVMPSVWPEAFGKVGIEAMSVGRPVVASDVGGISDWLVHGENGLLVPPKDSAALAAAVITLFSDTDMLRAMSKKAREKSEIFDFCIHVDHIEKIYRNLLNSKNSAT